MLITPLPPRLIFRYSFIFERFPYPRFVIVIISVYDDFLKQKSGIVGWDWRLLASLVYTESRFKTNAESWAGAYGLMQLMPVTANRFGVTKESPPEANVIAGIKYLKWLDKYYEKIIVDSTERVKFVLASYNAGAGHVEDARTLAKKK